MTKSIKTITLLIAIIIANTSFAKAINITVSILPQEYFVKSIGGARVSVQALVKPGNSPATYEPSPLQMAKLSQSILFFKIGVPFENALLPKIKSTMPNLKIIDTRQNIQLRSMTNHHHKHNDKHLKNANDPHIWLSPKLVIIQAKTILDTLVSIDPDGESLYKKNYDSFINKLTTLDKNLTTILSPVKNKTFLVFHPSWGYFADAYNLHQEAIEVEGKASSAKHLAKIIEQAKKEKIAVIFVQPQFSKKSATKIANAINGVVIAIDPLALNYVDNLQKVANDIAAYIKSQNNE